MAGKSKLDFLKSAFNVLLTVSKFFGLMELSALIALEARLAGRSIIRMVILSVMLAILITTVWLNLLGILVIYLITSLEVSLLISACIVLILNILFIAMIVFFLMNLKKNLFFAESRDSYRRISKD